MEPYSSTSNTDSSSSASYSHSSNSSTFYQYQQEIKSGKPTPPFLAALSSVRKSPAKKHVITKKPIAPLPPTPPRIYKVDSVEFKDVVQKLTGAAEFLQPTRLQEVAPPPLSLAPPQHRPLPSPSNLETTFGGLSPLGFSLSPSSLAWCSVMLLSPGTLASFEPSVVL